LIKRFAEYTYIQHICQYTHQKRKNPI